MKISYNLLKYRNLVYNPRMLALMFLGFNNELIKDDRKGTLDPYPIKIAGKPPKKNDAALVD